MSFGANVTENNHICGNLLQWLFKRIDPENIPWTYQQELKKTRALTMAKGKPSMPDFDFVNYQRPDDIETAIFGEMSKGEPIESMEEAKQLVRDLAHVQLWMPTLPQSNWQVSVLVKT